MPAPVMHFEVNLKDAAKGYEFYKSLFGWNVAPTPDMNYGLVDTGVKMGINGGIGGVNEGGKPSVVFYAQVEDIQSKLYQAVKMGGTVVVPLTEVPGMVTFAQFADPEGNIIGLIKGSETPAAAARTRSRAASKPAARRKAKPRPKAKAKAKPKAKAKARPAKRKKR